MPFGEYLALIVFPRWDGIPQRIAADSVGDTQSSSGGKAR